MPIYSGTPTERALKLLSLVCSIFSQVRWFQPTEVILAAGFATVRSDLFYVFSDDDGINYWDLEALKQMLESRFESYEIAVVSYENKPHLKITVS